MNKILVDKNTLSIMGYNYNEKPNEFAINVLKIDNINKTIIENSQKQKINLFGEKLYKMTSNGQEYIITEKEIGNLSVEPLVENIVKERIVKFIDTPSLFTLEDILLAKKDQLKEFYNVINCELYEINLQDNIDLTYDKHAADTGFKIIRLHPNGSIKLKPIEFKNVINNLKIYIDNIQDIKIKYSFDDIDYQEYNNVIINEKGFDKVYILIENISLDYFNINNYSLLF